MTKLGQMNWFFLDITASSDAEKYSGRYGAHVWRKKYLFRLLWAEGSVRLMILRCCSGEGADKISINSAALLNPGLIKEAADKFGRQCVVVAIDAKRRPDGSGWNVYKNGGRVDMEH